MREKRIDADGDVLEDAFQKCGLRTQRQVPSRKGRTTGYIDLLISDGASRLVVVEIEMGHKRVQTDIRKRNDLGDNATLWIVTPTHELATVIQKHVRDLGVEEDEEFFVLPFGAAVKRVSTSSLLFQGVRSGNENENLEHTKDRKMLTTILAVTLATVCVLVCACALFAFEQTEFRELKAVLASCVSVLCVVALLRGAMGVRGDTLIDTVLIPYEALVWSLVFLAVLWILSSGHRWIRRISRRRYRSQCARPQHQERHIARDEIRHSAIRTEDARGEVER